MATGDAGNAVIDRDAHQRSHIRQAWPYTARVDSACAAFIAAAMRVASIDEIPVN